MTTKSAKRRLYSFFNAALYDEYGRHPIDYTTSVKTYSRTGRGFYYTTPGGKPIYYPSAYRWPKCYHPSTLEIQVNPYWLLRHLKPPRGYFWSLDILGVCLVQTRTGESYHPTHSQILLGSRGVAKLLRQAIVARKRAAKVDAEIAKLARKTWVTLEDSVASGNCFQGSQVFAQRHGLSDCGAVRADYLLSLESSTRTRNAVRIAMRGSI